MSTKSAKTSPGLAKVSLQHEAKLVQKKALYAKLGRELGFFRSLGVACPLSLGGKLVSCFRNPGPVVEFAGDVGLGSWAFARFLSKLNRREIHHFARLSEERWRPIHQMGVCKQRTRDIQLRVQDIATISALDSGWRALVHSYLGCKIGVSFLFAMARIFKNVGASLFAHFAKAFSGIASISSKHVRRICN